MPFLTVGILIFQAAILVTILIAAKMGKGWFIAATVGWTAFTLLGSIYTMGLLLVQLITIFFSYSLGTKLLSKTTTLR